LLRVRSKYAAGGPFFTGRVKAEARQAPLDAQGVD